MEERIGTGTHVRLCVSFKQKLTTGCASVDRERGRREAGLLGRRAILERGRWPV